MSSPSHTLNYVDSTPIVEPLESKFVYEAKVCSAIQ